MNIAKGFAGMAALLMAAVSAPAWAQSSGAPTAATASMPPDQAQTSWTLTAGAQVTSGDYGSTRNTTVVSAPIGARWTSGPISLSASLPYVSVSSPGYVIAGFDGTPLIMSPDLGGPRRTHSGLGDLTLSGSYSFALPSHTTLVATGRVKVPLHDYGGVSSGKLDWSIGGEVSRPFGVLTPFASMSYRHYGNPEGWDIRDGIAASAGASARVGPGALAVSYSYAHSTSIYQGSDQELIALYDMPLGHSLRIAPYGDVGLSSGAPGIGGGVRIRLAI